MQDQATEAARVTPDMITAAIASADFHVLPGTQITICILTLRNGARVVGYNYGAIDTARQDWGQGRQAAYDMAREKVWELEGYALRERLAVGSQSAAITEAKLTAIVKAFVEKHHVSCPECIYQTDRVIENAYGLIEELCDVVGYYQYPEEEGGAA